MITYFHLCFVFQYAFEEDNNNLEPYAAQVNRSTVWNAMGWDVWQVNWCLSGWDFVYSPERYRNTLDELYQQSKDGMVTYWFLKNMSVFLEDVYGI